MKEHDSVVLTQDIPAHGLRAGDAGTIVLVHRGNAGFEIEFATLTGETVAVLSVLASQVRPIACREIAHVRALAG